MTGYFKQVTSILTFVDGPIFASQSLDQIIHNLLSAEYRLLVFIKPLSAKARASFISTALIGQLHDV